MSDVHTFIDAAGKDVTAVAAPKIDAFGTALNATVLASYGPRVATFANELVQDIIKEQAGNVRDLVTSLIQELAQRYQPEILGEIHARIVQGGIDLSGHGVKLDLKRHDTGDVVASLDIPIAIRIKVDDLALTVRDSTIKLDVVR